MHGINHTRYLNALQNAIICSHSQMLCRLSIWLLSGAMQVKGLRWAYHAFFHAVVSRRELWILVPPQLDSSDLQTSCSKAWSWCLNEADHHIIVCLLHVDYNVHLEPNLSSVYTCHLAVTHGSSLGSRALLHIAGYSQQQLWRIVSLAVLGDWTSRCCPVSAVLARILPCYAIAVDFVLIYEWR